MKIKVKYEKLGKQSAWGIADDEKNLIKLDPRLKGKKHLEILLHEVLHLLNTEMSETRVIEQSKVISDLMWKQDYRRVDNKEKINSK